jgi:hypothetical protein
MRPGQNDVICHESLSHQSDVESQTATSELTYDTYFVFYEIKHWRTVNGCST